MIVRVSVVLNRTVDDSHWCFDNCAQVLKKCCGWRRSSCRGKPVFAWTQLVFGQTVTNIYCDIFSIKLHFWSIKRVKDRTKYLVIQGFDGTKLTFDWTFSVDRLLFQALVWYSTFRAKVSCITSVDGIKLWLLTWLVNWSVNWHCYWLSVIYTVSLDVIGIVDSKNKHTMNSKRKEKDDHCKVSEILVADGNVG